MSVCLVFMAIGVALVVAYYVGRTHGEHWHHNFQQRDPNVCNFCGEDRMHGRHFAPPPRKEASVASETRKG